MSRPRKRKELRYWGEDGTEYVHVTQDKEIGGLSTIDSRYRLVDVECPRGHLAAVLVRNAGLPPLLMVDGAAGAHPAFILRDGQLQAAMTFTDEESGEPRVGGMGSPRDSFPILCGKCVRDHPLSAADLESQRARATPGKSKVPRLRIAAPPPGVQRRERYGYQ